jgi:serine/threonine protein kinase
MDSEYEGTRELRDLQPGQSVGGFRLVRALGQGGFGVAWLAVDPDKQDAHRAGEVVLKFLHAQYRRHAEVVAEFRRSYRVVQSLTHQWICPLYNLGEDERFGVFQVMAFVPGLTLTQYLQQGGNPGQCLEVSEVVRLLRSAAVALDFAHGRNIVHRDVKPDNLMVNPENGSVTILDFGLAADLQRSLTALHGQAQAPVRGTPLYMSPEQWGCKPDQHTGAMDQYSLAVVAWQMLVGKAPWEGTSEVVRAAVLQDPVPALPESLAYLQGVFERALAKDWRDRYPCVEQFVEALAVGDPGQPGKNPSLSTQLQERHQTLSRTHAQARQLRKQGRYEDAIAILESLDEALTRRRDEALYKNCCTNRDRVRDLSQRVELAVHHVDLPELHSMLAELIQLQPENDEWIRLREKVQQLEEADRPPKDDAVPAGDGVDTEFRLATDDDESDDDEDFGDGVEVVAAKLTQLPAVTPKEPTTSKGDWDQFAEFVGKLTMLGVAVWGLGNAFKVVSGIFSWFLGLFS